MASRDDRARKCFWVLHRVTKQVERNLETFQYSDEGVDGEAVLEKNDREESSVKDSSKDKKGAIFPEDAWRLLLMVNDWIKFADAKAGAALAVSGVMGTLLYNLVKDLQHRPFLLNVSVVLTCIALFLTVFFAARTLTPRLGCKSATSESINLLFFVDIAKNYQGDRLGYRRDLEKLSSASHALFEQVADQIRINSIIATEKTRSVTWSIRFGVSACFLLALVTLQISLF